MPHAHAEPYLAPSPSLSGPRAKGSGWKRKKSKKPSNGSRCCSFDRIKLGRRKEPLRLNFPIGPKSGKENHFLLKLRARLRQIFARPGMRLIGLEKRWISYVTWPKDSMSLHIGFSARTVSREVRSVHLLHRFHRFSLARRSSCGALPWWWPVRPCPTLVISSRRAQRSGSPTSMRRLGVGESMSLSLASGTST